VQFLPYLTSFTGVAVACSADVSETSIPTPDRRGATRVDRRKLSYSGRRETDPDPRVKWRRLAWLFAVYAGILSVRALPAAIKQMVRRPPA
jgi:hypothetical protein